MATKEEYLDYIQSEEWKDKSREFVKCAGKCEVCGSRDYLESHHLTYKNIGEETGEDIEVLCNSCHQKRTEEDEKKKAEVEYINTKMKKSVGGQDISISELREQEAELRELKETDPDTFEYQNRYLRKRLIGNPSKF